MIMVGWLIYYPEECIEVISLYRLDRLLDCIIKCTKWFSLHFDDDCLYLQGELSSVSFKSPKKIVPDLSSFGIENISGKLDTDPTIQKKVMRLNSYRWYYYHDYSLN